MLPICRARETLLAIAMAHAELSRLNTPERDAARERALASAANASSLGPGLGTRTGSQLSVATKSSPEPALFRFLRMLCGALMAKAALYFNSLLSASTETLLPTATSAGSGAALAGPFAPPADHSHFISSFVRRSGALLAVLLLQTDGLYVRAPASDVVYTCCAEEMGVREVLTTRATSSSDGQWPVLFMQPANSPFRQLWPCIQRLMSERQASLHAQQDVHVHPQLVSEFGGECTFWLCPCDPRIVLVLAFAGRKRSNDRGVLEFLRSVGELRGPRLVLNSLRRTGLGPR